MHPGSSHRLVALATVTTLCATLGAVGPALHGRAAGGTPALSAQLRSASAWVRARAAPGLGRLTTLREAGVAVLGAPGRARLAHQVAALVAAEIPAVSAVWGSGWARSAVVVLPASGAQFAALTGQAGGVARLAAATVGIGAGGGGPAGPVVVVNPAGFLSLSALGRRVVLTHELTHVATAAVTGAGAPDWLVEGFADYVAQHRDGLPVTLAASELASRVRAGWLPAELPADAEFSAADPRLAAVYEQAWLACRLVASRVGPAGLVRLYRAAAPGAPGALAGAVRRILGEPVAAFTTQWRAYLRTQLAPAQLAPAQLAPAQLAPAQLAPARAVIAGTVIDGTGRTAP